MLEGLHGEESIATRYRDPEVENFAPPRQVRHPSRSHLGHLDVPKRCTKAATTLFWSGREISYINNLG